MKQNLKHLIAQGKTAAVIQTLLKVNTIDTDFSHQVLLLSARFEEVEKKRRLATETDADLQVERNKIHYALLTLIERLPEGESQTPETPPKTESKTIIQNADKIYNIDKIDNANFS